MTTVDRNQFIRDLAQQRIDVRADHPSPAAQSLRDAGISQADLDRIAGSDHVIYGEAEYGRLYDRLQAVQAEAAGSGRREGNFDRAQQVYDQLRARDPSDRPAPIDLGFGSSRPRTTGIFGVTPRITLSDSDYVRTLGRSEAAQLDAAARRNTTGPEAGAQRRIRAATDSTVRTLEALERQRDSLPAGAERNRINDQIALTVASFEGTIASEKAALDAARSQARPVFDPSRLPRVGRDAIERQGIPLPGPSGAVRPTTTPAGGELIFRFK